MATNLALVQFMQTCLRCEDLVLSWGINRIQVSDQFLSFHVKGFNYSGKIIVWTDANERNLILNSAVDYIGMAYTAIDAIELLDSYIEANEEKYQRLLELLIK